MNSLIDLTSLTFSAWTVLSRAGSTSLGMAVWLCRCECGTERKVISRNLRNGKSTSCGCRKKQLMIAKFGVEDSEKVRKSPGYRAWEGARWRCQTADPRVAEIYADRGIEFRLPGYLEFWAHMKDTWFKGAYIDREDNDGHYEIGNVRWATPKQNRRNSRDNHNITYAGRTMCIAAWAEHLGIKKGTLSQRIRKGWPIDKAFGCPTIEEETK